MEHVVDGDLPFYFHALKKDQNEKKSLMVMEGFCYILLQKVPVSLFSVTRDVIVL